MGLTLQERFKALGEGKKLRMSYWDCDLSTNGDVVIDGVQRTSLDNVYKNLLLNPSQDDWEIYKEPKLKITASDIGRIAVFEDGLSSLILSVNTNSVITVNRLRQIDGTKDDRPRIIKVIDVGEE